MQFGAVAQKKLIYLNSMFKQLNIKIDVYNI